MPDLIIHNGDDSDSDDDDDDDNSIPGLEHDSDDNEEDDVKDDNGNNQDGQRQQDTKMEKELRRLRTHYNDGEINVEATGRSTRSGKYQNEEKTRDEDDAAFVTYIYNASVNSDPKTPKTFKEAITGPDKEFWIQAVKSEFGNFISRKSWIKTPRSEMKALGRKAIGTKHVFKIKTEPPDNRIRYKDRVVVLGYTAIPGVDFTESFAGVASHCSINLLLAIFLYMQDLKEEDLWIVHMVDVEAAFSKYEY